MRSPPRRTRRDERPLGERYGPSALVAGAGEGLGAAWVHRFLAEGLSTIIAIDRRARLLDQLVADVGPAGLDRVLPIVADLGDQESWGPMLDAIDAHQPGIVICNAAGAPDGLFVDQSLEAKLAAVEINALAPLRILDRALPHMRREGRGAVVLMSSLAAAAAAPRLAVYAATKAYLLSLGQTLNIELRAEGIDVLAIMPGTVATPGFLQTRHAQTRSGRSATAPADVVEAGVRALGRAPLVIPGRGNQAVSVLLGRVLPRRTANELMGRVIEQSAPNA